MRRPPLAALSLLLLLATGAMTQPASPPARAESIRLQRATAQQAFDALGDAHGCRFAPEEQWQGDDLALSVTLPGHDLWEAATRLGQLTGYEPVFTPYRTGDPGDTDNAAPVITLRRIDVAAEEEPDWGTVAGPLLVRANRAFFSVDLDTGRRRLVPVQVTIELELFALPTDPPLAVTATAARGKDVDGRAFARAGFIDTTTSIVGGIGTLQVVFDAPNGIPGGVAEVDAILRLTHAGRTDTFTLDPRAIVQAPAPAEAATRPGATDPRRLLDWDGFTGRIQRWGLNEEGDRMTLELRFIRGEAPPVQWRAFYATLQALVPTLGDGWAPRGKLVFAASGGGGGGGALPSSYRLLLLAERTAAEAPLPTVTFRVPTNFTESRARLQMELQLPIEAGEEGEAEPGVRTGESER